MDMVQRVSEALAQSFRDTVARVSGDSWEATGVTLPSKEVFDRYARAAIEAMRAPTEAMEKAGRKGAEYEFDVDPYEDGDNISPNDRLAGFVWAAMIDAALTPEA